MSLVLGKDIEQGETVSLPQGSRFQGTYIIGRPGTGKSHLLSLMMKQDLDNGHGFCLLDPHGELVDRIACYASHVNHNVILLDASDTDHPFGVNLFDCQDWNNPAARAMTVSHVLGLFRKLWGDQYGSWGPQLEALLRAITTVMVDNPGMTLMEVPNMLYDDDFRENLMSNMRDPVVRSWWQYEYDQMSARDRREFRRSTINRVSALASHPIVRNIVGQSITTVDIARAMDEGITILVKLPVGIIGDDAVSLIGSIIVRDILQATMGRAMTRVMTPYFLYADEYHRFATPDFATLIEEARKYLVGVTIAHQRRDQLDAQHRSYPLTATNLMVFQVTGADARELSENFNATPPERQVIGERPKRVISHEPMHHLMTGREHSQNEKGLPVVRFLRDYDELCREEAGEYEGKNVRKAALDKHIAFMRLAERYLYQQMQGKKSDKPFYYARGVWPKDLVSPPYISKELLDLYRRYGMSFNDAINFLADYLAQHPILIESGEFEPIYEVEMSVDNVRDKIANELANLPPYQARMRLRQEEGMNEFVTRVGAVNLPPYSGESYKKALERSRKNYTRPRTEVEEEIGKRSQLRTAVEVEANLPETLPDYPRRRIPID